LILWRKKRMMQQIICLEESVDVRVKEAVTAAKFED